MFKKILLILISGSLVFYSALVFANQAQLQKDIAKLDKDIANRKSQLSGQAGVYQSQMLEVEKEVKNNEKKLERHNRKIERAEERLSFVQGNITELDKWYQDLGAIDQGLNSGTYETKKNALGVDKNTAESELRNLNAERARLERDLKESNAKVDELKGKMASSSKSTANDSKLKGLIAERNKKAAELSKLRAAAAAKPKGPVYGAYVYAISGKKSGEIEKELKLKSWVESYKAKYIEANWNDLTASTSSSSGSMINFLSQMDKELDNIPRDSKLILVGYGLGGGAALLVANEIAKKKNRTVDLLVTLDPMGTGESRMNAVYETEAYCQGRISPEQYVDCISKAKKRKVTKNVRNFYNRWQRESKLPIDAGPRIVVNKQEYSLSTGKFLLESSKTNSNQKRVFYDDSDAHDMLLKEAAEELPKLLVTHLR